MHISERHGETRGRGRTGSVCSQRSSDPAESLKTAFEDLHSGSSLQCVERSDNLFKEKQITPQVKGHRGTLVKTFYVSLHCSHSMLFEERFHYKNILNQSLISLSSQSFLFTVV